MHSISEVCSIFISVFWKSIALNLLFCLLGLFGYFSINWILSNWQMTEILLGQFCIFLTNERCDWFFLSTFTLSMDLGSNLFYLVFEFLLDVTGDSYSFGAVGSSDCFKHWAIARAGVSRCPFSFFFKLLTVPRNVNFLQFFSRATWQEDHKYKLSKGSSSEQRICQLMMECALKNS